MRRSEWTLVSLALAFAAAGCSGSHTRDAGMDGGDLTDSGLDARPDGGWDTGPADASADAEAVGDASTDAGAPDASEGCSLVADPPRWVAGPELHRWSARPVQSVVTLGSGNVAVVGNSSSVAGAIDIYDVMTETWTRFEEMALINNTATLLPSGRALAVGSAARLGRAGVRTLVTEGPSVFVEDTDVVPTARPSLQRGLHAAAALADGRVLIAGGYHAEFRAGPGSEVVGRFLTEAEIFDEDTETWTPARPMNEPRWGHSLTLLADGRVLAVGGFNDVDSPPLASAEVYDPRTDSWTVVGELAEARARHEAQRLPSGRVLVVGGYASPTEVRATAELFDPTDGTWSPAPPLPVGVEGAASLALPSGRILLAGGFTSRDGTLVTLNDVFLFDEARGCWQSLPPLETARHRFGLARLPDGRILAGPGGTDTFATNVPEITTEALE